ncbi:pyruvate formate-lyase-activating protein [Nocardioides sp. YIM 152588]|uniref:pyruvate formate-lyase-activating protein n=1 Tax=Nocardioides sp. YIM 152588 TaxID=3158259 RepID=UPI0032E3FE81
MSDGWEASVHSWDLSTGVDGPGTRFVLFLSGCPLRCLYCQNPDTWHMRDGQRRRLESIMEDVELYRRFLKVAGGGVTASGGEPLLQSEFVTRFFRAAREWELPTALDTSGHLGLRADEELLAVTDLVLLDIKSFDPRTYRRLTGEAVGPTLAFAERLASVGQAMWIRFVLVPGVTDDPENVAGLAGFAAALGPAVERVEVLPFHRLGQHKYDALRLPFPLADTEPPDDALIRRVVGQFADQGLPVLSA